MPLEAELPTELPIVDLPPELELEHEVHDDEVDEDHVVQVPENVKEPVNSMNRYVGRMPKKCRTSSV